MTSNRMLMIGLGLVAMAAPALAQRGQYDERADRVQRSDTYDRNGSYDRDGRTERGDRYDRDDRDRRNDREGRGYDDRRGMSNRMPGGSWSQSCRKAEMAGGTLRAQCKDQRGKWRTAQINPRQCQTGRVGNRFGQLACE